MAYKIELKPQADKDLQEQPLLDQVAIVQKVKAQLIVSPLPHGNTIKQLKGFEEPLYRLRVNASQSYRVFYLINGDKVIILRIVPKKDADRIIRMLKKYL